jgi:hypothetical protein
LKDEVELRNEFVASLQQDSAARPALTASLKELSPLHGFGRTVREVGVQREWHVFRTERLIERIQRWAQSNKVEWKDAWLTEAPGSDRSPTEGQAAQLGRAVSDPLQVLFSGLDAADIQRISIPLDLVLKAISSAKKPS